MDLPSRELLGQVFTPPAIADLIAGLCIHRADAAVFDPCVGPGALLLAAGRRLSELGAPAWHRQITGVELDPEVWRAGRQRLAEAAGVSPDEIHVRQADFLGETATASFDAAIVNPPYTRQELLGDGRKREARDDAGLSRRAGLHAHFLVHLAGFVRPGGWLGAITPGTWLSAGYGEALRTFLLKHFRVHLLVQFERDVFPDACVEACVAILEKRAGEADASLRADTPVHFARLSAHAAPLEAARRALAAAVATDARDYQVRVLPQRELAASDRWQRHFPLPHAVMLHRSPSAVPLAAVARLHRGITTGNNRVLLLSRGRADQLGIEAEHLHPIIRSPREIAGLDTAEIAEPGLLLVPPGPDAAGSRAAAYLRAEEAAGRWGGGAGSGRSPDRAPSGSGRSPDRDLAGSGRSPDRSPSRSGRSPDRAPSRSGRSPDRARVSPYLAHPLPPPAPLLFGYAVRARKAFFRNSAHLLAGDNFFCITPRRQEDAAILFALLNAVPTALALELQGRAQGRGLLKVQRYELAELLVPDPERLDAGLRRELEALGEALRVRPHDEAIRFALDAAAARAVDADAAELRRAEQQMLSGRLGHRTTPG